MKVVIEGLRRAYGRTEVLRGLDVTLDAGVTGILGPNGAGKTTLMRILATSLAPTGGSIRADELDPLIARDRAEYRRRLGYLPQEIGYYPRFTAFQLVDYLALLKELDDPDDRHRRVRAALDAVDLGSVAGRRIRTLSGGMRRRVGIAQAIVADPQLLLLDEPTGGLDPEQRMRFRELITALSANRTVVLSTHLVEDIAAVCNTVVVLWEGRILFEGPPAALRISANCYVWRTREAPRSALLSWRTEDGWFRVIGSKPDGSALPVEPTLEDGYLRLTNDVTHRLSTSTQC